MTLSEEPLRVEERVRQLILEEIGWEGDPGALDEETRLLEEGVVDSMGIFQIISFLEEEYGITVGDEEVAVENFATLGDIGRLAREKAGG